MTTVRKAFLLSLVALVAHATVGLAQEGKYKGTSLDSEGKRRAVITLNVTDSVPPLFEVRGTLVVSLANSARAVSFKVRGVLDSATGIFIGRASGKSRGGKLRIPLTGSYNGETQSISLDFTFLGQFEDLQAAQRKKIDISGIWTFPDGVRVTITKLEDGGYLGEYRGDPAAGHGNLFGRLTGRLRKGAWKGEFSVVELSVFGNGTFEFTFRAGPPEQLVGSITSSSNIDPTPRRIEYVLTKASN